MLKHSLIYSNKKMIIMMITWGKMKNVFLHNKDKRMDDVKYYIVEIQDL